MFCLYRSDSMTWISLATSTTLSISSSTIQRRPTILQQFAKVWIGARTRVIKVGNKSFHLEQEIIDADTQEVKCRCFSVMVFYDLIQHKSMPIPDAWRQAIIQYDGLI